MGNFDDIRGKYLGSFFTPDSPTPTPESIKIYGIDEKYYWVTIILLIIFLIFFIPYSLYPNIHKSIVNAGKKLLSKLKRIDKRFLLVVITVISIFAYVLYSDYQKKYNPSEMDCLKLGSDYARRFCIINLSK